MSSDLAARTRQALGDLARDRGRRVDEFLQYYAMERFLYRLSQSDVRDTFVLKGAMLLRAWDAPGHRPTRDIDFLGRLANDHDLIRGVVEDICKIDVRPDGVVFDTSQIKVDAITANAVYMGVQVRFAAHVGNSRCAMRLDIGFGDAPITATFEARSTPLDPEPIGVTQEFVADRVKRAQWLGFVRRVGLEDAPTLGEAVDTAAALLLPPTRAALKGEVLDQRWSTVGHWTDS